MQAAVFVDFENLFLSLKKLNELSGVRTRDISLQVLQALKARLTEEGSPMVLGRSYAAFDAYPGMEVAHDLALMGLDPQYVLISHTGKNSADVQLALDVSRVLFRRADIELIVIVSGDRDFIPLARQVLEEGRELRVVAIPDTTSGDLRERVGEDRYFDALELVPEEARLLLGPPATEAEDAAAPAPAPADEPAPAEPEPRTVETNGAEEPQGDSDRPVPPNVVGRIPVTWGLSEENTEEGYQARLRQCLELVVRAQIRHGSREVWLSPFLKGSMSQHFSNLVHPERRALINDLRNMGVIRVEERENQYAEHPYSVIVIEEEHPMAQEAMSSVRRGGR